MLKDLKNIAYNKHASNIEMYSDRELIADGCKAVCDYETDFIRLDMGNLEMTVRGAELAVESYAYEQIDITGKIISVEFTGAV